MFRRIWPIFMARNKEFYRDKAAFGWNIVFPFLIIVGFAAIFQKGGQQPFKIGVIPGDTVAIEDATLPEEIAASPILQIVTFSDRKEGFEKLSHHKVDLLIQGGERPVEYWLNNSSPTGKIAESVLLSLLLPTDERDEIAVKNMVEGYQIDYIDWIFPGILAMNMMFSALFGVGWVIVRYRKNGVLKRFKATPLTAFEYLSAQVASRILVLSAATILVYAGCALLFDIECRGSLLDLYIVFLAGTTCIISLGLLIGCRSTSEEFANGILNLISWPMMFLSEVWFSLEGAPDWLRHFAKIFPLSHVTDGMRQIMNDGAGLGDIGYHIGILAMMTVVFMSLGSVLFKWTES